MEKESEKSDEMQILKEIETLYTALDKSKDTEDKDLILNQIKHLKGLLEGMPKEKLQIKEIDKNAHVKKLPLKKIEHVKTNKKNPKPASVKEFNLTEFEKETLKRLKQEPEQVRKISIKKPSKYVNFANRIFSERAEELINKGDFRSISRDLAKTQLNFLPKTYISVIFFTTLISVIITFFLFIFLLLFNLGGEHLISLTKENFGIKFLKTFWILFVIPAGTFLFMYFYPSLERKSSENKINQELPFATINMSAISGSMVEPSKIFEIILTTKEYPYLSNEFIKLINEINVLGYDLVTALRHSALNSPSKRLAELFNGLATTINSGGDLPNFFEKRAESLLFDYRLEREKKTRAAETFMDIYISVVIAAPMILMLLLMMMKISGFGISLSTGMITLLMVLGVSAINAVFLIFLHLKGGGE